MGAARRHKWTADTSTTAIPAFGLVESALWDHEADPKGLTGHTFTLPE